VRGTSVSLIALCGIALFPQGGRASEACPIANEAHTDTETVIRRTAMSVFAHARRNDAGDDDWLEQRVHPDADFAAWDGDDHIISSGKGIAGLKHMVSKLPADTYRYSEQPGILYATSNPCSLQTVEFDLMGTDGTEFWRVKTHFLGGKMAAAIATRYFVVTGKITELIDHG
jgi:hypothetical protein